MTERLFDQDGFLCEFTGTVVQVLPQKEGCCVVLDRTAFFPEGGGQSSDTGMLNNLRVAAVKERSGIIYHEVAGMLKVGDLVQGSVDFDDRFLKMQQHTGEHIVSGLIHKKYGYDNVGFHLGSKVCTLDFNGDLDEAQIREIECEANEVVFQDIDVEVIYPEAEELSKLPYRSKIEIEGQLRLIQIQNCDLCACCAPHVKKTGMVGLIKLVDCQKYKGGIRITLLSGWRALRDYQLKERSVKHISAALSAREDIISEAVERLQTENEHLREMVRGKERRLLQYKASEIDKSKETLCLFESELSEEMCRELVNILIEQGVRCVAVLSSKQPGEYKYIIGSMEVDVRFLGRELNARFSGHGGGQAKMIQGMVKGQEDEIRDYIEMQSGYISS